MEPLGAGTRITWSVALLYLEDYGIGRQGNSSINCRIVISAQMLLLIYTLGSAYIDISTIDSLLNDSKGMIVSSYTTEY